MTTWEHVWILDEDGDTYQAGAANVNQWDLAEKYPTQDETLEAGDIVYIDTQEGQRCKEWEANEDGTGDLTCIQQETDLIPFVSKTTQEYQSNTLGIVSTDPGIILGGGLSSHDYILYKIIPLGLQGQVPVKVNLENGPIAIGDRITSSSTPGIGMKATEDGQTIGVALEPYDGTGDNRILVFINLGYQKLTVTATTIEELDVIVQDINTRLTSLEDRVLALEIQLGTDGTITPPAEGGSDPPSGTMTYSQFLTWFTQSITDLGATLQDGIFTIQKLVINDSQTPDMQTTIGDGTIFAGESVTVIEAPALGEFDKVFVTADRPVALGVSEKTPEVGFMVTTSVAVTENLHFDWWIVGVEPPEEPADTTPPIITLVGPATIDLTVGDTYIDEGATALDDIDGDITSDIITVNPVDTSTEGTYTVTYNVSDTAGNPAQEVTRTVNITVAPEEPEPELDTTPPTITLTGPDTIDLIVGDTYIDEGATATDDTDGDITPSIVTVNPVDITIEGSYTVTYNVSDTAGNPAVEVTRTVNVTAL